VGHRRVALNAQTHALAFYARGGFVPCGAEYEEAGIPHRAMVRVLR
jgi:predicted GNAT family N-acyltransferase